MSRLARRAVAAVAVVIALLGVTWTSRALPVAADDHGAAGHATADHATGDHTTGGHGAADHSPRAGQRLDPAQFRQDMRKLWEDHITWTRLFIVSAEADLPDAGATAGRLLQNQADIGAAIAPFYGDVAGQQLTALLREHILVAADLIAAAKAGDTAKVATTKDAWYANADAIAAFLSQANPTYWPLDAVRSMMHDHLDQTLAEAVHHLAGDFGADITDYDRVHEHILAMADALADGIVQQFPQRFHR